MKKLKIEELIPGMITAEDIYNYNDQLILPKGLVLNQKAISKLQFYAVYTVRIEDEMAEEAKPVETPVQSAAELEPEPVEIPAESILVPAARPVNIPVENSINIPEPEPVPIEIPAESIAASEPLPSEILPVEIPAEIPAGKDPGPGPDAPAPKSPKPKFKKSITPLPAVSYQDKIKSSQDFQQFKQSFDEEVQDFKVKINEVVLKNAPLDINLLLEDALNLISQGSHGSYSVFDMLRFMKQNDDTTYTHCINVGLFCNVFAGWLKLSEEETSLATLCGLLHDVGKLKVPEGLLKKNGHYTEDEKIAVNAHTREGYLLVKNMDIDNHIKNAVLTHHERCDGSGYPFGLSGFRIDPYAKMVAIADVYDAMTSKRSYRSAMSPIQAIEVMQKEGLQKYDVRFIMIFLENVMNTFIGNRVLLSTGEKGDIIFINKSNITRPTIKCPDRFVDLDEQKDIEIVSML